MTSVVAFIFFLHFLRTFFSHPVPSPVSVEALTGHIDDVAEKVLRCRRLPGLTVAVVRAPRSPHGQPQVVTRAYGFADTAARRNALPTTRFCVAGLTQAFTAAVLNQLLLENQTYTLDTPLEKILGPTFQLTDPELSKKVTTRDILSHQVGIAPYFGGFVLGYNMTRAELIRRLRYVPVVSEFRQSFVPSPLLYVLAGQLVQVLNDTSWENVITRRIFKPLRMTGSTFADRVPNWAADFALPHVLKDGQHVPLLSKITGNILRPVGPSGSICSTSTDMSKWLLMLLQNGSLNQPIIHPDVIQEMFTPQNFHFPKTGRKGQGKLPVDATSEAYNFGWISGTYKNRRRFFQNAFSNYYGAFITLLPDDGIGIFTAANGPSLPLMDNSFRVLHYYIMDIALGEEPWLDLKSTACLFPHPWFGPSTNQTEPSINSITTPSSEKSDKPKISTSTSIPEDVMNNLVSASTKSVFNWVSTPSEITEDEISEFSSSVTPEPTFSTTKQSTTFQTSSYSIIDEDQDYEAFFQSTPFEIYKIQNFTKAQNATTLTSITTTSVKKPTQRPKLKFRFKTRKTPRTSTSSPANERFSSSIKEAVSEIASTALSLKQILIPLLSTSSSLDIINSTDTFQNVFNSIASNQTVEIFTLPANNTSPSLTRESSVFTVEEPTESSLKTTKTNVLMNHRFPRPFSSKNLTNFKNKLFPSTKSISTSTIVNPSTKDFTKGFIASSPKQENYSFKTKGVKVLKKQESTLPSDSFGLRIKPTNMIKDSSFAPSENFTDEPEDFLEELVSFFPSPIDLTDPKIKTTVESSHTFSPTFTDVSQTSNTEMSYDKNTGTSPLTSSEQIDAVVSEIDLEEFITSTTYTNSFGSNQDTASSSSQLTENITPQKNLTNQNTITSTITSDSALALFDNFTSTPDNIINHLLNFSSFISKHTAKLDVTLMNAVDSSVDQISPITDPKVVTSFVTDESIFQTKNMTTLDHYIQELIANMSSSENPLSLLRDNEITTAHSIIKQDTKHEDMQWSTLKITNPNIFTTSGQTTSRNIKNLTEVSQFNNDDFLTSSTDQNTFNLSSVDFSSPLSTISNSPSLDESLEELEISSHFRNLGVIPSVLNRPKVATILASLPIISVLPSVRKPTTSKTLTISSETSEFPPPPSRNTISNIFFERQPKTTPIASSRQTGSTPSISPVIPVRKFPIPSRRRLSFRQRGSKTTTPPSLESHWMTSTASQDEITDVLLHLSTKLLPNRRKREMKLVNPYPDYVGTYTHQFFGNIVIFFNRTSGTLQMEYGFYGKAHLLPESNPNTFRIHFFSAIWYASEADDTKRWPRRVFLVHFKRPTSSKPPNKIMIPLFEPRKPPIFLRNDNS